MMTHLKNKMTNHLRDSNDFAAASIAATAAAAATVAAAAADVYHLLPLLSPLIVG